MASDGEGSIHTELPAEIAGCVEDLLVRCKGDDEAQPWREVAHRLAGEVAERDARLREFDPNQAC